jgi:hypothetical protein
MSLFLKSLDLEICLNPIQSKSKSNLPVCVKLRKKQCNVCEAIRSEYYFYKKKTGKDNLSSSCIICHAEERRNKKDPKFKPEIRPGLSDREVKDRYNEDRKKRYSNNPSFKMSICLRNRVRIALKGKDKSNSTLELLDIEIDDFKKYIESLWLPGMNWDNHGVWKRNTPPKWSLDHIKPCAAFDLSIPEQQKICFHYTNIQPLWGIDNIKKRDSF